MASGQENHAILLQSILRGGVVNNPKIAKEIAALIIENTYGQDELARQTPLIVHDDQDRWIIEGSYNKEKKQEGDGPVVVIMKKRDAQIVDLHLATIVKLAPGNKKIPR